MPAGAKAQSTYCDACGPTEVGPSYKAPNRDTVSQDAMSCELRSMNCELRIVNFEL